jgi:glycosyltransferase involved in cell wall biosynthesis
MRVAYVVGRHPAVSHTFILREVQALRALGVEVEPISINRARPEDLLSQADRDEAARTYSILPPRWGALIGAHAWALATRPAGWFRALGTAWRLARPGLRGKLWELFYFAEAGVVWRRCRRLGVDHIHVHFLNQASDATIMAVAIEGRGRWTWSYTMHGPDEFLDRTSFRLAEKARSATAIACISDFARSQTMAALPEDHWPKLEVIHCGLDPDEYRRSAPPREGDAGGRVLFVGRLVEVKGPGVLLDALAALRADGVEVEATLVGDGPSRAALERTIRELGLEQAVTLAGYVGQDEIRRHYEAADVFVLPSFAEGLPVVLMEAMALELPVVTTRIAGIPELVEDGVSGFVVAPGRADLLAGAIRRLLDDPALRRQMGARGRERVVAEFDVRHIAPQLRDFFERVSGRDAAAS